MARTLATLRPARLAAARDVLGALADGLIAWAESEDGRA